MARVEWFCEKLLDSANWHPFSHSIHPLRATLTRTEPRRNRFFA